MDIGHTFVQNVTECMGIKAFQTKLANLSEYGIPIKKDGTNGNNDMR